MVRFRRFLSGCFGILAILSAFISLSTLRSVLFGPYWGPTLTQLDGFSLGRRALTVVLLLLAKLVLAMPAPLAIFYGMAWWSARRRKPAVRGWAIAASVAILVQCIPIGLVTVLSLIFRWRGFLLPNAILLGILLFFGIGGLVAFAGRHARDAELSKPKPPRVAGDGTSGLADALAWVLAGGVYLLGTHLWWQWAAARRLPHSGLLMFWVLFLFSALIEAAAHESSHAVVGLALGMRLRTFIVGPFQWALGRGRWSFAFQPRRLLSMGGAVNIIPIDPSQAKWVEVKMIAAGPLGSLCTGFAAMAGAFLVNGTRYDRLWELLALTSTFGFTAFVVNLLPLRTKEFYTDGAQIFQRLAGGPWADYHRAIAIAEVGLVTPLRPRDYDIDAIRRAEAGITRGPRAVLIRLLAYNYFHDCGNIPAACEALNTAEAVCRESAPEVPAAWLPLFVFGKAFLERDAAAARVWWERMEAKKLKSRDEVYWLAKSALDAAEGNLEAARKAWSEGNALADCSPKAGAHDFNRDCFVWLRKVLDDAPNNPIADPSQEKIEVLVD